MNPTSALLADQNHRAYAKLAQMYDDVGFSEFSAEITEPLIIFMQRNDWIGRRVLELGCGTGRSTAELNRLFMDVIALDRSAEMLEVARRRFDENARHVDFLLGDMLETPFPDSLDLVWALGAVINELMSLRQIETVFQKAFTALRAERWIAFDMLTLRGLADVLAHQYKTEIIDITERNYLTLRRRFSYDSMTLYQNLTCFTRIGESWQRSDMQVNIRSYPYEAIMRLLEKVGFELVGSYQMDFHPFNPIDDEYGRCIILARKPKAETTP